MFYMWLAGKTKLVFGRPIYYGSTLNATHLPRRLLNLKPHFLTTIRIACCRGGRHFWQHLCFKLRQRWWSDEGQATHREMANHPPTPLATVKFLGYDYEDSECSIHAPAWVVPLLIVVVTAAAVAALDLIIYPIFLKWLQSPPAVAPLPLDEEEPVAIPRPPPLNDPWAKMAIPCFPFGCLLYVELSKRDSSCGREKRAEPSWLDFFKG